MSEILILSGAGLSAQSGIKTFRDSDGLWENYDVMEVCSAYGFKKDRKKVMEFYNARRADLADKKPNLAHFTQARLKEKFGDKIAILTQNVDNLLESANCQGVIHLHGTLTDLRCEECGEVFDIGYESSNGKICPKCKSDFIRHNVVMFNEPAPYYEKLYEELNKARLLVCIGTSGHVLDIAYFANAFKYSILNNLHEDLAVDRAFQICLHESAVDAAPKIERYCENFIQNGDLK